MINIPSKIVLASKVQSYANATVGSYYRDFVCPVGNSNRELNEMNRISAKMCARYLITDNKPYPAFVIDRPQYGSNRWVIIDPRGFRLSIPSSNLEDLIQYSTIHDKVVQDRCVWVRNGNETGLTLVPETHPSYSQYVSNTQMMESAPTELPNIGDTVYTQYEMNGEYMGCVSLYGPLAPRYNRTKFGKPQSVRKVHVIKVAEHCYFYKKDLKIIKIVPNNTKKTLQESVDEMNRDVKLSYYSNSFFVHQAPSQLRYFGSHGKVDYISVTSATPKVFLEKIDKDQARDLLIENQESVIFLYNNQYYVPYISPFRIASTTVPTLFTPCSVVDQIDLVNPSKLKDFLCIDDTSVSISWSDIMTANEYYKIVKKVKKETYI